MLISSYIINLHNKGYSNKYISKCIYQYNKYLKNILTEEESLKFVECIIVDYITSPSL